MTPAQRAAALRLADALDADDFDIMHDAATILRELAAAPQQRQPLTDEQYQAISDETGCVITGRLKDAIARAVVAAHDIRARTD